VTILDAFAVIAFLRNESCADDVAELLRSPTAITAVNVTEVVDQLVRVFGYDNDDAHANLALLAHAGMEIAPVTADIGLSAGRLRATHYRRHGRAISLADCTAAATALATQRSLATADPALAAMVRAEGGRIHSLAGSTGLAP
jgi:PIN domain nuclease of toxin-antitoxin system